MSIPFKLNIFKQIEIYQDLKELDDQFLKQLKKDKLCKNPPTWFFEKKILHWAYLKHKHLGSPLKVSHFLNDEYIHRQGRNLKHRNFQESIKGALIIEENVKDIHYTEKEIEVVQIRKVFGNMEVKGFAKFFKENENNYWNIDQGNCDGIFLTTKGLAYARMIHSLYKFKNIEEEYKKIEGVEKILKMVKNQKRKFDIYVYASWFVIIGSILLFSITLYKEITNLS